MAECTVGEYPGGVQNGMQAVKGSTCVARSVLNVGVASSPVVLGSDTRSVRIWTDTKMAWRFGKAGQATATALTTDEGMSAGATEYFNVEPGDSFACIAIP